MFGVYHDDIAYDETCSRAHAYQNVARMLTCNDGELRRYGILIRSVLAHRHYKENMEKQQKLILFADDFKDNRDLYGHFLTASGFRVALASDGEQAVEQALQLQPDIIVMDLSMPVVDGWEATQRLKADHRTRHIPILLLTAYGPEDVSKTVKQHCQGILEKPCRPDHMVAEVMRVLNASG
jgi:two-component system, cell cycle response regulator DivK